MGFDLTQYLNAKRALVEERLDGLLRAALGIPASLRAAMRYSLLAPGKRLRPCLVFMATQASGGGDEQAWPAACAIEMIHTYSLIHDDLPAMDDDDLRRGQPTCHRKFGEALAILAGDGLLTLAFQVLAEHLPPRTAAACCLELARGAGAEGMVAGQVEDLAWERSQSPTVPALEHVHSHKTGALLRACLRLGVLAAQGEKGAEAGLLARLDRYGQCFGLVFQITDDLLDVESDAATIGKQTQKDAARGKLTYPGLLGVEESRRRAKMLVDQAIDLLTPLGRASEPLSALIGHVFSREN